MLRRINNLMKNTKISILLAATVISLTMTPTIFAVSENSRNFQRKDDNRDFVKATVSATKRVNKLQELEDKIATRVGTINKFINSRANINNAKVTNISGSVLTVIDKDGKTITVNTDANSRLRRRFFGSSNISEISVNDILNIFGKWTDDTHTIVQAQQIRDLSIQKRFGVFVGDVTAINGNTITLKSINRGTQAVTVSSTTKFIDRKEKTIVQTDVVVGHRIRVKGMWNNASNTITEVKQLKDFSLPIKIAVSPTSIVVVSPTPTGVVTPTPTVTVAPTATPTP
jgi:hypothetical protein